MIVNSITLELCPNAEVFTLLSSGLMRFHCIYLILGRLIDGSVDGWIGWLVRCVGDNFMLLTGCVLANLPLYLPGTT